MREAQKVLVQVLADILPGAMISSVEHVLQATQNTRDLITKLKLAEPQGFQFFRALKGSDQESLFIEKVLHKALTQEPIEIYLPVCPDFGSGYVLGTEIGETAQKALAGIHILERTLQSCGFSATYALHLADVEAEDPLVLQASGETTQSFLSKTSLTESSIQQEIRQQGLQDKARLYGMRSFFEETGRSYNDEKLQIQDALERTFARNPQTAVEKSVRRTAVDLLTERRAEGDLPAKGELDQDQQQQFLPVLAELAGYSAYGKRISETSGALIASPDAFSAVNAYNFGTDKAIPVAFISKKVHEKEMR